MCEWNCNCLRTFEDKSDGLPADRCKLKNNMRKSIYLPIVGLLVLLASCNAQKEIVYFQDTVVDAPVQIANQLTIKAQPLDQLHIVVNTKDPETASLFTLHQPSNRMYALSNASAYSEVYLATYTVDEQGNIDFPVLGTIHVGGLTRQQIASKIKQDLIKGDYVKDPIVTVNFANAQFTVAGEVSRPGKYSFDKDRITLMEALGMAGDLTILGRRDNVKVIREENGKRMTYCIDMRSSKMFDSPAYYIKQNDVIYVEPNKVRAGQSTINDNSFKSVSLWVSISSLLTSVAVLIFK